MPTNLSIEGYAFVCVPIAEADFADVAAIYVVICVASGGSWFTLDVGQSGDVGDRIDSHDRRGCWQRYCASGNIWICVHRMPSSQYTRLQREQVEAYLRAQLQPKCGKR